MRKMVVCLLTLLGVISGTQPSLAHSSLAVAAPSVSQVVYVSPTSVKLTFDEDLIAIGSANHIEVRSPSGALVSKKITYVRGAKVTVFLNKLKQLGAYQISYRIVSADGHIVSSFYYFYLKKK